MKINTLKDFYTLMYASRDHKKEIVKKIISRKKIHAPDIIKLESDYKKLTSMQGHDYHISLQINKSRTITFDLTYEITELEKDIYYLTHENQEFLDYLDNINSHFEKQACEGTALFKNIHFQNFITDRDGTINNYCGRYQSSIQSIYNFLYLYYFSQKMTTNSVILTSAPLLNPGIIDVGIDPFHSFIYAASKGREFIDKNNKLNKLEISKVQQNKLDQLNNELKDLTAQEEYEIFTLIGSGLQFKFGQTTITYQDIFQSIPQEKSKSFRQIVMELVSRCDRDKLFFRIEDTGKDLEITLTIDQNTPEGHNKDFDKGNGLDYLDSTLGLQISKGPNLICGDTDADVAMVKAAANKTDNNSAIFVTTNGELKNKVRQYCKNAFFVDNPDNLMAILFLLSKKGDNGN